eukprot:6458962-Amphidinium_carterae.1
MRYVWKPKGCKDCLHLLVEPLSLGCPKKSKMQGYANAFFPDVCMDVTLVLLGGVVLWLLRSFRLRCWHPGWSQLQEVPFLPLEAHLAFFAHEFAVCFENGVLKDLG